MTQPKIWLNYVGMTLTGFISLHLISPSQAVTIRHDVADANYLALANNYASVGQIQSKSSYGSGVLIAPNWVLTAGHNVENATNLKFTLAGRTFKSSTFITHPRISDDLTEGYDLALIKFNQDLSQLASPAQLYKRNNILGKVGTFVGFGTTGTGLTGITKFDGKKRAVQNRIDRFMPNSSRQLLQIDFDNPSTQKALGLEGLISLGDSGGGMFINVNGSNYLAGIHSFIQAYDGESDSNYGDLSGQIFITTHFSWINSIISSHQANLNFNSSSEAIPEPFTILGTIIAVGFGAMFKRKLSDK